MRMLTTGDCAEILNAAFDAPDGFTAAFVLAEVDNQRLKARINEWRKSRRRIRIHPEDFIPYLQQHYAAVVTKALSDPRLAA